MAKELTVKSKFFSMEDKVEVEGLDKTFDTVERFENAYINSVPAEIKEEIDAHFDDTNRVITISKEEAKNVQFKNLASKVFRGSGSTISGMLKCNYNTYSQKNGSYTVSNNKATIQFAMGTPYPVVVFNASYSGNKFQYSADGTTFSDLSYDLEIIVSEAYYLDIKQLIILDLLETLGYKVILDEEGVYDFISNNIRANTGSGEINLTSLSINGTKYKLGGSGYIYTFVGGTVSDGTNTYYVNSFTVISDTALDTSDYGKFLKSISGQSIYVILVKTSDNSVVIGRFKNVSNTLKFRKPDENVDIFTVTTAGYYASGYCINLGAGTVTSFAW